MGETDAYPADLSSYTLVKELGKTNFSNVSLMSVAKTGEKVVIKKMEYDEIDLSMVLTECRMLTMLNHSNIIDVHRCFLDQKYLCIVMPVMEQDLKQLVEEKGGLTEKEALRILSQIISALDYIHSNGFTHRDIKAANVFIDSDGNVKLGDFGTMKESSTCKTFVGTPNWMAPEVMEQGGGYTTSADIWSLGIVMIEIINGYAPYYNLMPMQIILRVIQKDPPTLDTTPSHTSQKVSKSYRSLIRKCLQKDPSERPTTKQLMSTKILKKYFK